MPHRRPRLHIDPPKMAHGDANRMADMCDQVGTPLVPWQREFLSRLESASMSEQFADIIAQLKSDAPEGEHYVRTYDPVTDTEEWIGPLPMRMAALVAEGFEGKRQTRVYHKSELPIGYR